MIEKIKLLSKKYYPKIKELRHQIHMHPELEFEEENTAKLICECLDEAKIPYKKGIAKTGVLAMIEGKKSSNAKCVLLRADMDALPVEEETNLDFASKIKGKMHACGHDGHSAALVGAALILNELKDEFEGCVKIMFQPAEEGSGGAKPMIDEGILENPKVDAVFGCHLWGALLKGTAQIVSGEMMAGVDVFDLEFIGKGGHGAHPHTTIDPVLMSARFINGVQSIISRRLAPTEAGVITIGCVQAGTTFNVIPQNAILKGTVRYLNEQSQKLLQTNIQKMAEAVCLEFGGSFKLDYKREYPPLINDKNAASIARKAFAKVLKEEAIITEAKPDMGAEDFAFLTRERMGAYVFVGISKDLDNPVLHHNPKFCFDDEELEILMQGESLMALEFLSS
ncbi:amidohydrolase [Campylobacter sp. MIT 99-7217]|uniref:M20 metallopeptidase family protein n=1 Tax=Campylobacter sp. MIT 99-7217 TaxID=535091 RepID=UPI00115AFA9B|nr:M20 family metallopeptidase [Campylobacter sp. MIT 99-7217]TQR28939.1 amidohydrolase [Campylobacter sp. MIT 99-7217]